MRTMFKNQKILLCKFFVKKCISALLKCTSTNKCNANTWSHKAQFRALTLKSSPRD